MKNETTFIGDRVLVKKYHLFSQMATNAKKFPRTENVLLPL